MKIINCVNIMRILNLINFQLKKRIKIKVIEKKIKFKNFINWFEAYQSLDSDAKPIKTYKKLTRLLAEIVMKILKVRNFYKVINLK